LPHFIADQLRSAAISSEAELTKVCLVPDGQPTLKHVDLRQVGSHPDHWYPLAWSHEVKPGKALGTQFAGDPIVLFRNRSGEVFALEDRCAHRQVPLSLGLVDGDGIRCAYHGWTYSKTGRCTDVPYLGKGQLPNGVRAYRCREAEGLIFVFPGDDSRIEYADFPTLGSVADPRYKTRRFGGTIGCHYTFMHENLMDMNHQFLHRAQMGQIRPRYLGRRLGDDWLEVDYTFARSGGGQSLGERVIFGSKRVGGWANNRDKMTIRTSYPYQSLQIWAGDDVPVMHLWIVYVPLDAEQRTNRTFGLLSVRRPRIPLLIEAVWPLLTLFTERIFAEDRKIVELEQAAYDRQGADLNLELFPPIQDLRRLLAKRGVSPA
jgi:phenylpropionate dioxygenase-like ring-hydroxylating dioxygenase large terminal subunit